jgi:hypothetical protein
MASIKFAVVTLTGDRAVKHIYLHRAEADGCVNAYRAGLGIEAAVVEIRPPLAFTRLSDAWCTFDQGAGVAYMFVSPEDARADALARGTEFIHTPIRQALPVQTGVPQFTAV